MTDTAPLPNCKGSWAIGTACKKCDRCIQEALATHQGLLDSLKAARAATEFTLRLLPEKTDGHDVGDQFKIACFDELRRMMWGAKK